MARSNEDQDALDRADKDAWREREGWFTAEEAELILAGKNSPRIEFVRLDQAAKTAL